MTIETTVNKHRGALLIAIGGFLVFLYIRHKRQQAAAAAAAQAAAAAAAADPGTMDQNTYSKQFSQPAPAYLGSPFSGYGANAPNFPPPTQPPQPTAAIEIGTLPNPAASSGNSTVGAATGGGPPASLPPIPSYLQVATPERPDIQMTQAEAQRYLGLDPSVYQSLQTPVSAAMANTAISPGTAFSGAGQFVDSPFGPSWQWSN